MSATAGVSKAAATRLERLRRIALALPETAEVLTWDVHPTFRVREKIFVIVSEAADGVTIKSTKDGQAALVAADPRITIAPYVGRHGWVNVAIVADTDWDELADLIVDSYRLVAPKKLAAALGTEGSLRQPG